MFFLFEERRAFVRTATHTVVPDTDPDYARFALRPDGRLEAFVRVWLARGHGPRARPVAYLGFVRLVDGRVQRASWERVLSRLRADAPPGGLPRLRRRLPRLIRAFSHEAGAVPATVRPGARRGQVSSPR